MSFNDDDDDLSVAPPQPIGELELALNETKGMIKEQIYRILSHPELWRHSLLVERGLIALSKNTMDEIKTALHFNNMMMTEMNLMSHFGSGHAPLAPLSEADQAIHRNHLLSLFNNYPVQLNSIIVQYGNIPLINHQHHHEGTKTRKDRGKSKGKGKSKGRRNTKSKGKK
jgi:hypothetical protein